MEKKVVSAEENKILKKMFWNSHLVFSNFNMTKMEANGFTMTMAPAVESIYGDDIEGKKAAYARHQSFFNTHAVAFNFIAGLCYALEKDCHDGKVPGETIDAIKASLMGPTAGMFDSIFFNCLRVIGAGIAIGLCSQGNIIDTVFNSGLMSVATRCASILGLMMVGAMTATTVGFPLNWTLNIGETSIVVSELFDAIYPGILSLALVLFMMWRIKKGNRPTQLIIGLLIFGLLGAFLGIF